MSEEYRLTEEEKNEAFREQVSALENSCAAFDSGQRWEAKRLATAIYVLCHDPPKKGRSLSKSLLGQLGLKDKQRFISTARPTSKSHIPWLPLVHMTADDQTPWHYVPNLKQDAKNWRWLSFSRWWEEAVFKTAGGRELSRKFLVLTMRSQDAGSHADEVIRQPEYAIMRKLNDERVQRRKFSLGGKARIRILMNPSQKSESDAEFEPIPDAHLVTVRQIAFEVLESVGRLL